MVEIDGKKIREARLSLALSTDEFADLLGVTSRTIRNWEGGHTGMRMSRLRKIAALSGKPATWFYAALDNCKCVKGGRCLPCIERDGLTR
jgi:DNA-binding transcriptional regulator YiaG